MDAGKPPNPDFPNPVPPELRGNVVLMRLEQALDMAYNWSRARSVWPMFFGLACCAIEFIATGGGRWDKARFGMEVIRPSPRQCDLIVISGTVTKKMAIPIVRIYNQMAEPRYVVSMGACANGGGPFKEGYNVVDGIDKFLPVDVYIPGCPPTPQALLNGYIQLHKRIEAQKIRNVPWYRRTPNGETPVPVLGPDLIDPRRAHIIRSQAEAGQTEPAAEPDDAEEVTA
jgi:NADH-quinone oxidoreductase subunit B